MSNGTDSVVSSSNSNSPRRSFEQASESSIDRLPTQKVRTLKELYESCSFALAITDPGTYDEVIKSVQWREAMEDELKSTEDKQLE